MKNIKLKLFIAVLIIFSCIIIFPIDKTFSIYKEVKRTTINLSVLDPSTAFPVTLDLNDGLGTTRTEYRTYNQELGSITSPTRTDYNFLGWYDGTSENANRVYSDQLITGPVVYYAHWQKIVWNGNLK